MAISGETKTCIHCSEVKPVKDFARNKATADGRRSDCKTCFNAKIRARRAESKERRAYLADHTKRCTRCVTVKDRGEFGRNIRSRDGLQSWCRACNVEYQRSVKNGTAHTSERRVRTDYVQRAAQQRMELPLSPELRAEYEKLRDEYIALGRDVPSAITEKLGG